MAFERCSRCSQTVPFTDHDTGLCDPCLNEVLGDSELRREYHVDPKLKGDDIDS